MAASSPYRSLIGRLYRFTWQYKMTPPGKLLTAIVGIASIGTVSVEVPIYFVCCGFLGLIFAAEVTGSMLRPRLKVEPRWPVALTAGETTTVPVRVTNTTWRPALDVMVTLLERPRRLRHTNGDVVVSRLGRDASYEIPLELRPTVRGRLSVPAVDAHSTFPFNLVRIPGGRSERTQLTVRPSFPTLSHVRLPFDAAADLGEYAPSGEPGESIEYLGNRDYTPGEPIKRLDARAWARTGQPVIKEYQNDQGSRVGILIDSYRPGRSRSYDPQLEAAISLGLAIGDSVIGSGYDVGLLATGTDLYTFERDAPTRMETLLDLTAELRPTRHPSYHRMIGDLLDRSGSLSAMLVVLSNVNEATTTLVQEIAADGPPLRVLVVGDEATVGDLPFEADVVSADAIRRGEVGAL